MKDDEVNNRTFKADTTQRREEILNENFSQSDFDRILINFMINGMHPLHLLQDESFSTLLNDMAMRKPDKKESKKKYKIMSPTDFSYSVDKELVLHKANVFSILEKAFYVSTTVDAYETQRKKIFLGISAHWIDVKTFKKMSTIVKCEKLSALLPFVNEAILERIQSVYLEYELEKKIIATVTNNDSNVPNLFSKSGVRLSSENDGKVQNNCEEVDSRFNYVNIERIDNQIHCPTYLFELIGAEDASKALNDFTYADYHKSVFEKLNELWKRSKETSTSEQIANILGSKITQPTCSAWTSLHDSIANLLKINIIRLNEVLKLLDIPILSADDVEFMKEYVKIMEPISTAIDYLQKNDCYYATFLPMVHSTKDNLIDIKTNGVNFCLPLLNIILGSIDERFGHLFEFTNEKCIPALIATCTHPFFKMRWLKGDLKTASNTNMILDILVNSAKTCKINLNKKTSDTPPQVSGGMYKHNSFINC